MTIPNEQFTFFWHGPFSQWAKSPFTLHDLYFKTAEHYMMWFKDQVFSGGKLAQRILDARHPSEAKALGREVENFDKKIWDAIAKIGVFRGNMAKFSQNPHMLSDLLLTEGTTLVEASPEDTIWGIGLAADDPRAQQRDTWLGTNWLGEVLTDVRTTILEIQESLPKPVL